MKCWQELTFHVINGVAQAAGVQEIVEGVMQGLALQIFLRAPFLLHNLSSAFELSRIFTHTWSVNLVFLPEPLFLSRGVASALPAARLALLLLLLFACYRCATLLCRMLPTSVLLQCCNI